ncbi:MAG: NAD-dependent epimerase/dehydratase family protein [Alphaproteobacteria bacterium]
MQTVLVTGANGFVGRRLCRHLANSGYQVRGSLRMAPARDVAENSPVDYVVSGNIDETTDWQPHLAGIDAIIHCAARVNVLRETAPDPLAEYRRINVAGTERLARQAAAAGVRRFVLISSNTVAAVEAHDPGSPPPTPYQISKRESEVTLFRVAEETGIEAVVLRPPLIYGPGDSGFFRLLLKAIACRIPFPFASIRNRRSIIFVGNLVDAARACIEHPAAAGQTFPVSDGAPVSTPGLVRALGAALGQRVFLVPFPPALLRFGGRVVGQAFLATSLTGDQVIDDSEIQKRLDWHPCYDMDEALAETVAAGRATPSGKR